jgi:AraC-like DNA-binding protein
VPKFDQDHKPIQFAAPLRGSAVPEGKQSALYKEVQSQLWNNKVLIDCMIQRWMLSNLKRMELSRYCDFLHMKKPTVARKLKEMGVSWSDLKLDVRYRYHLAMIQSGHTAQEAADSLGCSVSEQNRWMREQTDMYGHVAERRRASYHPEGDCTN